MKNNKIRKGFTLTEMVIVIVIIALLAAVLIPMYSGLVNKAKNSDDTNLVKLLNDALMTAEIEKTPSNMQEAVEVLDEIGYKVPSLQAKASKNTLVWNQKTNRFYIYSEGTIDIRDAAPNPSEFTCELNGVTKEYDLTSPEYLYTFWVISDTVDTLDTFSTYYTGTEEIINTSKGFDAGTTTSVKTINYTNEKTEQDVIIRSNSAATTLAIYDPDGKAVNVYGTVGKIVGTKEIDSIRVADETVGAIVADNSLHIAETAVVDYLKIAQGHVENNGTIELIYATTNNIKVTNNGSIDHAHATRENAENLNNSSNNKTENITFDYDQNTEQNANAEVYHHITLTDAEEAGTNLKGDKGITRDNDGEVTATDNTNVDGSFKNTDTDTVATEIVAGSTLFAGGKGTEDSPFLISTAEQLQNIWWKLPRIYEVGENTPYYYYQLTNDIDATDENWTPIGSAIYEQLGGSAQLLDTASYTFYGDFNGNGYTIKYKYVTQEENPYCMALFASTDESYIHDFNLNVNIQGENGGFASCGVSYSDYWFSTFENIMVTGNIVSQKSSSGFTCDAYCTTFINCKNYADITVKDNLDGKSPKYKIVAGISDQAQTYADEDGDCPVTFKNCANYGALSIINTGSENMNAIMGGILGQSLTKQDGWGEARIVMTNCSNNGIISITGNHSNDRAEFTSADKSNINTLKALSAGGAVGGYTINNIDYGDGTNVYYLGSEE